MEVRGVWRVLKKRSEVGRRGKKVVGCRQVKTAGKRGGESVCGGGECVRSEGGWEASVYSCVWLGVVLLCE